MGYGKRYGYGLSVGKFGDQSETIEVHTPELNIARTAVLDYFADQRDDIPITNQIFCWENGMAPEQATNRLLAEICDELGKLVGPMPFVALLNRPFASQPFHKMISIAIYRENNILL
jgi:hypothetical protein